MERKKGFTLVELLVVISIIALLMAILLPSLGKAKYMAGRVVCKSNIKDQFLIQMVYATDYDGKFPSHCDPSPEYFLSPLDGSTVRIAMDPYMKKGSSKTTVCRLLRETAELSENQDYLVDPKFYGTSGRWAGFAGWDGYTLDKPTGSGGVRPRPDPTFVLTAYMWFANYTAASGKPNFDFIAPGGIEVHEPPWPNRTDECSSRRAFIAHRVSFTLGNIWDLSHGGSASITRAVRDLHTVLGSLDNPVGYSDGHVETVLRAKTEPRARITDDGYWHTEIVWYY